MVRRTPRGFSRIVRTTAAGQVLDPVRIVNDPDRLTEVIGRTGECPEVGRWVLEATYGVVLGGGCVAAAGPVLAWHAPSVGLRPARRGGWVVAVVPQVRLPPHHPAPTSGVGLRRMSPPR